MRKEISVQAPCQSTVHKRLKMQTYVVQVIRPPPQVWGVLYFTCSLWRARVSCADADQQGPALWSVIKLESSRLLGMRRYRHDLQVSNVKNPVLKKSNIILQGITYIWILNKKRKSPIETESKQVVARGGGGGGRETGRLVKAQSFSCEIHRVWGSMVTAADNTVLYDWNLLTE